MALVKDLTNRRWTRQYCVIDTADLELGPAAIFPSRTEAERYAHEQDSDDFAVFETELLVARIETPRHDDRTLTMPDEEWIELAAYLECYRHHLTHFDGGPNWGKGTKRVLAGIQRLQKAIAARTHSEE